MRSTGLAITLLLLAGCASDTVFRREPTPERQDPYTVRAKFYGENSSSERRLNRIVEDYMLDLSHNPSQESAALDAALDLVDHYRSSGFADAEVAHRIERDDAARELTVVFEIVEGPQVTTTMRLENNTAFDDERLLTFWLRTNSSTLGLGDPLFVENDIDAFASSLRIFYRTQGYRDARVADPSIERQPASSSAAVTITIDEGLPYRLSDIRIGDEIAAAIGPEKCEEIRRAIGSIASVGELEDARQRVVTQLRRTGYPTPAIRLAPSDDQREQRTVRLTIFGDPGPRGRITEITLRGNEQTADWYVRQRIEFAIGDWFDGSKIDATRRELYLSGLFRRVDIETEPIAPGQLRVVVDLEEDESRSIDVLGGFGSYERARGMVRFEERNVFGTGRRFSVEGRLSRRGHRAAATWTNPHLFGSRFRWTLGADIFEREEPSFVDEAHGFTTAVARRFGNGWRARVGYAFRQRSNARSDLGSDLDNFTEGNVFTELEYDQRDSVLYPRSGYLLNVQFDADDPALGSDIQFTRARFSASGYLPIYRDLHLALRASTGALWPGESSARIPLQERFFNGGESTVRSFRESRLGPLDPAGSPAGGEFRNIATIELRVPMSELLEGSIFTDAGNVGSDVNNFGFSDIRYAIGAGLRLKLPIGPIRVDAAYNPVRDPGEDEWVIHLSVGYPF